MRTLFLFFCLCMSVGATTNFPTPFFTYVVSLTNSTGSGVTNLGNGVWGVPAGSFYYTVNNGSTNYFSTTNIYCGPVSECIGCTGDVYNYSYPTNYITESNTYYIYYTYYTNYYSYPSISTQIFYNTYETQINLGIQTFTTNYYSYPEYFLGPVSLFNGSVTGALALSGGLISPTSHIWSATGIGQSNAPETYLTNTGGAAVYTIQFGGGNGFWFFYYGNPPAVPVGAFYLNAGTVSLGTFTAILQSNDILNVENSTGGSSNKYYGFTRSPIGGN